MAEKMDSEREAFEAWLAEQGFTSKPEQRTSGKYVNGQIQGNWLAWQARARLTQPAQAVDVADVIVGARYWLHVNPDDENDQAVPLVLGAHIHDKTGIDCYLHREDTTRAAGNAQAAGRNDHEVRNAGD